MDGLILLAVLVVIVLLLFLRRLSATVILAVSIPVSLITDARGEVLARLDLHERGVILAQGAGVGGGGGRGGEARATVAADGLGGEHLLARVGRGGFRCVWCVCHGAEVPQETGAEGPGQPSSSSSTTSASTTSSPLSSDPASPSAPSPAAAASACAASYIF